MNDEAELFNDSLEKMIDGLVRNRKNIKQLNLTKYEVKLLERLCKEYRLFPNKPGFVLNFQSKHLALPIPINIVDRFIFEDEKIQRNFRNQ